MDRSHAGATTASQVFPVSMVCRSQRAHGLPRCFPAAEEAQLPWGKAYTWWQAPRLPHSLAGPSPSLSLGSLTATTAAPLAFWRVLIGQDAQPPGPRSPAMSRARNLVVCRAQGGSGRLLVSSTWEKVWDARPDLWAVATNRSERGSL